MIGVSNLTNQDTWFLILAVDLAIVDNPGLRQISNLIYITAYQWSLLNASVKLLSGTDREIIKD